MAAHPIFQGIFEDLGLTPKPAPKSAAEVILADMRALADSLDKPPTDTFEAAMSALTYAVGMLDRNPPVSTAQHNRMTDQITRLETVENRSRRMIQIANDTHEPTPPTEPAGAKLEAA